MSRRLSPHWPIPAALALLALAAGWLYATGTAHTGGRLIYSLDDPYIHMAMAKNVVRHGVWGITRYGFTSSSSSLLWTLLLSSLYALFGVNEWAPFALNLLFGAALVWAGYRLLAGEGRPPTLVFALLAALVLATPVAGLAFVGMEHLMHALATVLLARAAADELSEDALRDPKRILTLRLLAALVVLARYEGLFLVFVIAVLLLIRRRASLALMLGAYAITPVLVYGVISQSMGWYLVPNSVLLKGKAPDLGTLDGIVGALGFSAYLQLVSSPPLLFLVVAALVLFAVRAARGAWERDQLLLVLFVATALLHLEFAKSGQFYRYEAYLIAFGLLAVGVALLSADWAVLQGLRHARPALALLVLLPTVALADRTIRSMRRIPQACRNVWEQQFQMGLFLRDYFPNATVAANDVGAINYLADPRCVDLWGLGTMETARAIRTGHYFRDEITAITRQYGVQLAVVYERPFTFEGLSAFPPYWRKAGEWRIRNNVAVGYDTVSFFAADGALDAPLRESLKAFAPRLPGEVIQGGAYMSR